LSRIWAGNHDYGIPRTNLHAEGAARAGVVVGFYVGGERLVADADQAIVPWGHGDAGFTTGALVIIDERYARRRFLARRRSRLLVVVYFNGSCHAAELNNFYGRLRAGSWSFLNQ
jgi:hypothetical protein